MVTLSISPSKLEQFRKYEDEAMNGFITEEKVIESIKTKQLPSDALKLGLAYHKILEEGHEKFQTIYRGEQFYKVTGNRIGSLGFSHPQILPAVRLRHRLQNATFEVGLETEVDLGKYKVKSLQRVDALLGLQIHEFKTTSSKYVPRYSDFYDSIQWRFYLLSLPDAQSVNYTIFHFRNPGSPAKRKQYFPGEFRTVTDHSFKFDREEQNENVIMDCLDRFVHFCERNDLIEYLKPRTIF